MTDRKVTLICTVYNEGESIRELLNSVVDQTRHPDEAVFVDGGSTDQTTDIIEEFQKDYNWIELYVEDGCNIAEGRNIAVRKASNNNIISTDGGCVLDEDWVKEMTSAFDEGDYIIGMFEPSHDNLFEEVQGRIICSSHTVEELRKGNRGPSSRSVGFTKEAWEDAGGYPEDLYTGEDSKFNAQIMSSGHEPVIAENAMVYWKMRPTWTDLYKQFYKYGEGDAKGGNLFTHPSQKLGVTKNAWLLGASILTALTGLLIPATYYFDKQIALIPSIIFLALMSIPELYYFTTLKQLFREKGLKAFTIGKLICQVKYWAWADGFIFTILKKPSLIPYQFKERKRLK